MKFQSYLSIITVLTLISSGMTWIRIRNKGGYVARFFVDYHVANLPKRSFSYGYYYPIRLFERTISSGNYPIGQTRVISVPPSALTARIRAERFIFYPFFGWYWKEIFRQEISPQDKRCYDIWGTTVQPYWTSINC